MKKNTIGFLLALGGGDSDGLGAGPCTGRPLRNWRNSLCNSALFMLSLPRRPVRMSRSQRTRPKRPSTLPRAFRSWANWSTTPARAKNEEWVAMNVDSSICARPAKVCTTEWRRVNVVAVVDSSACVTLAFVWSNGMPGWPNPPIPPYAPGYMPFMFMPYPP